MKVKVYAEEVIDGRKYKGTITLDERVFNYEVYLPKDFVELDAEESLDPKWFLEKTDVKVSVPYQEFTMKPEEKTFFFGYALKVSRDLFYNPQRCDLRFPTRSPVGQVDTNVLDAILSRAGSEAHFGRRKYSTFGHEQTLDVDEQHPHIQQLLSRVRKRAEGEKQ